MTSEMFRIFSLPVSGYQFFYILGLALGAAAILLLSRREKLDTVEVAAFILLGIVCGWIGSRMLGPIIRLLTQPLSFRSFWDDFQTGGSFFGAIAASLLFAIPYARIIFKNDRRRLWDTMVIGIALGHAVGRLGCFAAGCCYGKPTSLPWGASFISLGGAPHPFAGIPLHPVQLYEAALVFILFIFLIRIRHRRRFPGEAFCFYLTGYGLIRFSLEFLRHNGPGEMAWPGGLSWYQVFSLFLVLAGWLFRRRFKKIKNFTKS
jgi:phosphatidylglycerol:prolipoprotein diacylglycerol transferase